jgi:signal peptidase I
MIRLRVFVFSLIVILSCSVSSCVKSQIVIEILGDSMEPNYSDGTQMIVEEVDPDGITRGALVYFQHPSNPSRTFLKRVIGLPGETIRIENGLIYINGELFEEPYQTIAPADSGNWVVDDNAYFVLGDNRPSSADSRYWGALPYENIIGIALPKE